MEVGTAAGAASGARAVAGRAWRLPPARHSAGGAGSVAPGVDGGELLEGRCQPYTAEAFHRGA